MEWFFLAFRRRTADKKTFQDTNTGRIDVELATLQNLPRNGTFVQSNNILYSFGPITDGDIALLPQIRREQITIACFLGSGAFGEVYEGFLRNVGIESETRVAIKTLRKGATEQEKGEFLQEAQLMSNFKHKHILSLIGVCFDTDSLYIIMELMQGGDLLSFLRQSRPSEVSDNHKSTFLHYYFYFIFFRTKIFQLCKLFIKFEFNYTKKSHFTIVKENC